MDKIVTSMYLEVWKVEISVIKFKHLLLIKETSSGSESGYCLVTSVSLWRLDIIMIRIFKFPYTFLPDTSTFSIKICLDFSSGGKKKFGCVGSP